MRLALLFAVVLGAGTFLQFALGALAPLYVAETSVAAGDVGMLFSVLLVVALTASPLAGRLVDVVGPLPCLAAGPLLAGAGLVLVAAADSLPWMFVAMVPAGLGMSLVNPAVNAGASALAPGATGLVVGTAQAGVQAGALLAGLLALAGGSSLPWRLILAAGAVACASVAVAALRLPRPPRTRHRAATPAPEQERRTVRRLAGYAFTMGTGSAIVFAFLPLAAVSSGAVDLSAAGWTAVIYGGVALLCRIAMPRVLSHVTDGVLISFAVLAAVSALLFVAMPQHVALLWVGAALFGLSGTTWPAAAMLGVALASGPERAGAQAGRVTAGFYAGLAVGPLLARVALGHGGFTAVWCCAAAAYVSAAALVVGTSSGGGSGADGPVGRVELEPTT
jgi:MFS family permease